MGREDRIDKIYRFWGADAFGRQDEQDGMGRMGREDRIYRIYRFWGPTL